MFVATDKLSLSADYCLFTPFTLSKSAFTEKDFSFFFYFINLHRNLKTLKMRKMHHHAEFKCQSGSGSKLRGFVFAFFLLGAGTVLLLGNAGVIDKSLFEYIFSWQSLLIAFGIFILAGGIRQHWFFSTILMTVGTLFLLDQFYEFKTGVANMIWPAILIIIGIAVLIRIFFPSKRKRCYDYTTDEVFENQVSSDDYINVSRVFSGANMLVKSQSFKGGKASFIFGGGEFDLRGAQLAEGINILKIECVFGGVKIILPEDWDVSLETSGVFGGFSDERRHLHNEVGDRTRKLIIKGEAVFGGGEITN